MTAVTKHPAQGGVWAGTYGEGLLRLAPETRLFDRQRHRRDEAESLAQGRVRALYEDHEGTLWVGSVGGGSHDRKSGV